MVLSLLKQVGVDYSAVWRRFPGWKWRLWILHDHAGCRKGSENLDDR